MQVCSARARIRVATFATASGPATDRVASFLLPVLLAGCSAATPVAASGHRGPDHAIEWTSLGPAVQSGLPSSRGR